MIIAILIGLAVGTVGGYVLHEARVQAKIESELRKVEASASAEAKTLIARIRAVL